jgi:hypothetical protein
MKENNPQENLGDINNMGVAQGTSLNCSIWLEDSTVFIAPTNVEFTDVTELLKGFTDNLKDTTQKIDGLKNKACDACNLTPDESTKMECLASLGCK